MTEKSRLVRATLNGSPELSHAHAHINHDVSFGDPDLTVHNHLLHLLQVGYTDRLVGELLARHGVPGDRLECEISEHTVMADPRRAMAILERLRGLGVKLSLDDFGTGHSSLSYLKRLPLDEVKIDRSFVIGMTEDDNDAAIVRTTIDLARNLGLEVVAEGVESETILRNLSDLSCDVAQGFYLSRPLPAAELDGWLAERSVTPSK